MAHLRKRYVSELIEKAKKMSPIIGLLGHRQVGKTTVLESLCTVYKTLDDRSNLELAMNDEKKFINELRNNFAAIDECQIAPPLFPALKEFVRKNKKPGQFLLSGSVRFTSRKAIRESLTGRIVNFELLPFSISEIAHLELPNTVELIMKLSSTQKIVSSLLTRSTITKKVLKEFQYYFERGGLPGVCFINDKKLRELRIKEQILTILDRDVRMVYSTTLPYSQIFDLFKYVAIHQGEPFNFSDAERETRISSATIKKLLYAFEAVFIIRRLSVEGSVRGETFYLEDQAESLYMCENKIDAWDQFAQLIYRNVRAQMYYTIGASFKEFVFKTRGQMNIPYAISFEGMSLGIIPLLTPRPSKIDLAACASFLRTYSNSRVLFLTQQNEIHAIDDRTIIAPVFYFV